jgi:signal transduction histidine kinase/CheY-like chemotaxis protein
LTFGEQHQLYRTVPLRNGQGEIARILVVAENITERKVLQAQVAQSDRLASMGMLAAGVAHEINNPLTYVLYNLDSLTRDLPAVSAALMRCRGLLAERLGEDERATLMGDDDELLEAPMLADIQERFEDALHGTERIVEIARGLGLFSRVDQDRLVPVALRDVIEGAINMVFNEIKYRAKLVKEYGETSTIMANDGRLSQVFLNLLVNAAHAIPENSLEENEIRVRTWQEGDEVFAEVRDTGHGIPRATLMRIFEPFFTTKAVGSGTGLGLPISRAIVEEHGGRIEVRSEVGRGTSFVVRLPLGGADWGEEQAPPAEVFERPEVSGRILVIDDDHGIRRAMTRMLKAHEVVSAGSGAEAQKILRADQAFDLLLCDVIMPGMSGVALHEWIAATYPDLADRVVFVTGGAFTPASRDYLAKVDNLNVDKPIAWAELRKTVGEMVRAARKPER